MVQPHQEQHQQQQSPSNTEQVETPSTNTTSSSTSTTTTNEILSIIDLASYADTVSVHCLYCIRTFYEYDGIQIVTDQLPYASVSSMYFVLPFMKSILNFIGARPTTTTTTTSPESENNNNNEISFLKTFKQYLEALDLLQEYNRKFYFPTLDTTDLLTLDEKRHYIYQGIYTCLCEGNATLQSKIAALGEIKTRVLDALNYVNETKRRIEESLECDDVVVAMETPTSINANVGKRNGDEKVEGDEDEERIVSFSNDDGVVPWRPQRPHPTRIVEETPNNLKKGNQKPIYFIAYVINDLSKFILFIIFTCCFC